MMFGLMLRYGRIFSLAIVEMDGPSPSDGEGPSTLPMRHCATLLPSWLIRSVKPTLSFDSPTDNWPSRCPRPTSKARKSSPQRLQTKITNTLGLCVCVGVSAAATTTIPQSLVKRVQTAVFAARSSGGNCVFRHTGYRIEAASHEVIFA